MLSNITQTLVPKVSSCLKEKHGSHAGHMSASRVVLGVAFIFAGLYTFFWVIIAAGMMLNASGVEWASGWNWEFFQGMMTDAPKMMASTVLPYLVNKISVWWGGKDDE